MHHKVFGVGNQAMRTASSQCHALLKRFARALTERRMIHLVIDLMDVLREAAGKAFESL